MDMRMVMEVLTPGMQHHDHAELGTEVLGVGAALILPGVTIGSGTVIGAGSIVTRDLPANVFAAGNPCRVIREITADERRSAGAA